jgi:hypothetical protein
LDAFVDPQVWWERQQELLALDRTCDHCGKVATIDQVGSCQYRIQLEFWFVVVEHCLQCCRVMSFRLDWLLWLT